MVLHFLYYISKYLKFLRTLCCLRNLKPGPFQTRKLGILYRVCEMSKIHFQTQKVD